MRATIRSAIPDDGKAIARVHVASWQEAYRSILPAEFLASLSVERRQVMWKASIETDVPHVLTAEVEGEVVGFSAVGASRGDDPAAAAYEVWAIYVAPSQWDTGVGRALWLASRQYALERGARTISAWVIANNARAIRFYRAAGFAPEPNSRKRDELGGVQIEELKYVHRVDA